MEKKKSSPSLTKTHNSKPINSGKKLPFKDHALKTLLSDSAPMANLIFLFRKKKKVSAVTKISVSDAAHLVIKLQTALLIKQLPRASMHLVQVLQLLNIAILCIL